MKHHKSAIVQYILDNLDEHPCDIAVVAAREFGISRQGILRHIRDLADKGIITIKGKTRDRRYALKPISEQDIGLTVTSDLKEDEIWRQHIRPLLKSAAPNVISICQFGLTEMLNNVVDHSEGDHVSIKLVHTPKKISMQVLDNGVGIFSKIQSVFGLEDPRHAILELAKGKLTTDPDRHTGEGIFFTSRIFDYFSIHSGGLCFAHQRDGNDWLLEEDSPEQVQGTLVSMEIASQSHRLLKEVFDFYASKEDDYGFTKTIIPVNLARYGDENLISRSQAKRLLTRIDRFAEVILDFKDVKTIGQAFADEVFRVFRNQNPQIKLSWIHDCENVENMIKRVIG